MGFLFSLFFIVGVICLLLYEKEGLGAKIGFGLNAVVSFFASVYFLSNLHQSQSFTLFGNFLFSPSFVATPLENFFCFLVCFMGFLGSIFSLSYAKVYEKKANISLFASMYSFFILTMLMTITSDNVFSFLLLWEIMTLLSAMLIMINDKQGAGHTIMVYLGVAQFGAFCLLGALLIMGQGANSFVFLDFKNLHLSPLLNNIAFILLFIGFGSKAGLWPFHFWLKKAYALAPSNVCALMSGVMIKVGIFAFIKFSLYLNLSSWIVYMVLFFASMSVIIGALYAAVQENAKSAIAYSTCENAGIIFLGIGSGLYGYSQNLPLLASLGFVGALFHMLNHATFKSLMFFACGSVYKSCGSNDMNLMGGFARKMPKVAFGFLIATMAMVALPPLNGFTSEWLTYKSLLLGGIENSPDARFFFIFAILFLAVGGTVALFAFVKVYGAIFSGLPRDKNIYEKVKESNISMLIPIFILALCCIGFGLSAKFIATNLSAIINHKITLPYALNGQELISLPTLTLIFALALLVALAGLFLFKANFSKARITEPWASGYKYDTNMQIGSRPFSGDLRHILKFFYRQKKIIEQDGYFGRVRYENKIQDIWWNFVDKYIIKTNSKIAHKIGVFQNGQTNIYAGYILIYMGLMFVISYYLLGGF